MWAMSQRQTALGHIYICVMPRQLPTLGDSRVHRSVGSADSSTSCPEALVSHSAASDSDRCSAPIAIDGRSSSAPAPKTVVNTCPRFASPKLILQTRP